jgi:hypothetical protein
MPAKRQHGQEEFGFSKPPREEDDAAFFATYGAWEPLSIPEIASLMGGFVRPWWVVGGYALEAFTGVARRHEDVDISYFADAFPEFQRCVGDRYHMWSNDGGVFRLIDEARPDPLKPLAQVWLRRDAQSPWVLDVSPTPMADGMWQSKRDADHVAPLDDVTWVHGGVRYLNPEVVLLFKARQDRAKDRRDLEVAWPMLSDGKREWLVESVGRVNGEHPWLGWMG